MNLKSCHLLCWLFICLSICQCNKEDEDAVEEEKLRVTEEEDVELVVAAIYKVANLFYIFIRASTSANTQQQLAG